MIGLSVGLVFAALSLAVAVISFFSGDLREWTSLIVGCAMLSVGGFGIVWLLGRPMEVMVVNGSPKLSADGSVIEVGRGDQISAYDGAVVRAGVGAVVHAHKGSLVYALAGAQVTANAGSTVRARPWSNVEARKGSTVYAEMDAAVSAYGGSNVFADQGASVFAYAGARVTAKPGAAVVPREEGAIILVYGAQPWTNPPANQASAAPSDEDELPW